MTVNTRINISVKVRRALPKKAASIIKLLSDSAEELGVRAYLVGGFVRDLLIGVKNLDVDITVEGDAIALARHAAKKLNAVLLVHKRFGTATLITKKPLKGTKLKIDLATARRESYSHPAALPRVKFSSLRGDLYRRDFTINAMAVSLHKDDFGELIDFFGGMRDLKNRKVRVLHDNSFIDDPTRIFRAVRFEQRYSFKIDRQTEELIKKAVKKKMFDRVSGERLRSEIEFLLKEREPLKAVKRMRSLHELRFISPDIKFDSRSEKICRKVRELHRNFKKYLTGVRSPDMWLVYFMAIIDRLTPAEALKVCNRLTFKRSDRLKIQSCKISEKRVIKALSDGRIKAASEIYRALEGLSSETLLFLSAKCGKGEAKKKVIDHLRKYDKTRLKINGSDLKRMGVKPGPDFTAIFRKTMNAKIDGRLKTKRDELSFAEKIAREG